MKDILLEEISLMKKLFDIKGGFVISEQNTLPGGISKQAYDKIIAVSQQNKKKLSGSYLAPLQQREIDAEFGAGTYDKFFNNGGQGVLDNKKVNVPKKTSLPQIPLPNGISKQAYEKIMAVSQQNKKKLSGSYLAPAQQRVIDAEFGAGTYDKFFNNGGRDVLDGKKVFKLDTPAVTTTTPVAGERQTNINNTFCSVRDGKITTGASNGKPWESYKTTYSITAAEEQAAKQSCKKSPSGSIQKRSGGSGQSSVNNRFTKSASSLGIQNGKMDTQTLQTIISTLEGGQSTAAATGTPDLAQLTAAINQLA